jgi:hypothetical protein
VFPLAALMTLMQRWLVLSLSFLGNTWLRFCSGCGTAPGGGEGGGSSGRGGRRQLWLSCSELLRQAQHYSNRLTFRTENGSSFKMNRGMLLCEQNETLSATVRNVYSFFDDMFEKKQRLEQIAVMEEVFNMFRIRCRELRAYL